MQPRLRLDIGWGDLVSTLWPVRASRAALEVEIAAHAPEGTTAVVALSVRTLFDALVAEVAVGRPVVMSAVTIADMATLARGYGCVVRPVDIDPETLAPTTTAVEAVSRDAVMVVLAHLYGRRSAIAPLAEALGPDRPLIVEDCAQAFGGRLSLSEGADVALYSFGPIKTATALGGGVAVFRDAALARRVTLRTKVYPPLGEAWFLRRVVKHAVLKAISQPVVYARVLRWLARGGRDPDVAIGATARGFPDPGPITEAVRRSPPRRMLRLLVRRLVQRRARPNPILAEATVEAVARRLPVPGRAVPGNWWLLPVLHDRPDALVSALRRHGQDATRGATSMRAIADGEGEAPHAAARLMATLVYLPKPLDEVARVRLCQDLSEALEEIAS